MKHTSSVPPLLALALASGLVLISQANIISRTDGPYAELIFWAGYFLMIGPVTVRLGSFAPSRRERIGLVVALGGCLFLIKVFQSPGYFTSHDEFAHWRTLSDIVRHNKLFTPNPLIPASAFYPGLELATNALFNLNGMPIFGTGIVLSGIARILLGGTLYLFYEEICRKPRLASMAALVYMINPNFVFFDSMYSYESLALPLAVFLLWICARHIRRPRPAILPVLAAMVIGIFALVGTHHLTTWVFTSFVCMWAVLLFVFRRYYYSRSVLVGVAAIAITLTVVWVVGIATFTVDYLLKPVTAGVEELTQIAASKQESRELFKGSSQVEASIWHRLTAFGSVGLALLGLPAGFLRIFLRYRTHPSILALALGAFGYPVSLGLRFTQMGAEASNRAAEFVFLGVGFVIAIGFVELFPLRRVTLWGLLIVVPWIAMLGVGGIMVGHAHWAITGGSYLVTADTRSIDPQGIEAGLWAAEALAPDSRILTDRINRLLMAAYAPIRPVTAFQDGVASWWPFFAQEFGEVERDTLRRGQVDYLIVDLRLSWATPLIGFYFEEGEPHTYNHVEPISRKVLEKFETVESMDKIFDSGEIRIYAVRRTYE